MGRPQWIANDEDGYARLAGELVRDVGGLRELRRSLRDQVAASELCDASGFARRFERVLREAWEGQSPRPG